MSNPVYSVLLVLVAVVSIGCGAGPDVPAPRSVIPSVAYYTLDTSDKNKAVVTIHTDEGELPPINITVQDNLPTDTTGRDIGRNGVTYSYPPFKIGKVMHEGEELKERK